MLAAFARDTPEELSVRLPALIVTSLAQELVSCLLRQEELAFAVAFLSRNWKQEGKYELNAAN